MKALKIIECEKPQDSKAVDRYWKIYWQHRHWHSFFCEDVDAFRITFLT